MKTFISHRSTEPDLSLARQISSAIKGAGYDVFLASDSIRWGENWPKQVDDALETCEYFVLLLSEESAHSEMVIEEVRRAKHLRETRGTDKPRILTIRVRCPQDAMLNYDLDGYLARLQQRHWNSVEDTAELIAELLSILAGEKPLKDTTGGAMRPPAPGEAAAARPLPVAEPEIPEGQVTLASKFYIDRGVESRCYASIERSGALIRIKAPRQMGKTSLMSRIIASGREKGYRSVGLSFQIADENVFGELDSFLGWFCSAVAWKLGIDTPYVRSSDLSGSKIRATSYFERFLLEIDSTPLLIALDEVDLVFDHPALSTSFFSMLRAWHEEAKNSDLWGRLRLVIVHSTEAYIPLKINQSPFNVGLAVGLPEFTELQVAELARRHQQTLSRSEMTAMMSLLGGHPYLTRVVLYELLRSRSTFEAVCANIATEAGIVGDHLRRHFWNLSNNNELASAMSRVVASEQAVDLKSEHAFKLESMGLVHRVGARVTPRCSLYRTYFKGALAGVF